ncbi:hypothetical protein [Crateriforma spongiae]|uniref:hypothetical protein n=1 Tax=Crateriforma spongiae TaxID=2724528 RepID=UPI001447F2DD|nr:hypothetical protein [Crateriforma spongiae]
MADSTIHALHDALASDRVANAASDDTACSDRLVPDLIPSVNTIPIGCRVSDCSYGRYSHPDRNPMIALGNMMEKCGEPCDDTERRWSPFSQWLSPSPPPAYRYRCPTDYRTWHYSILTDHARFAVVRFPTLEKTRAPILLQRIGPLNTLDLRCSMMLSSTELASHNGRNGIPSSRTTIGTVVTSCGSTGAEMCDTLALSDV